MLDLKRFNAEDLLTCVRASPGLVRNSSGAYSSVGNNVLRRSFENGGFCLLAEETRTNSLPRSNVGGAVVGVIGSGGSLPTGWGKGIGTFEVVATGTENGLSYIDVRYTAADGASGSAVNFVVTGVIDAADGQTWTNSAFARRVGGSTDNLVSLSLAILWAGSTGTYQVFSSILDTPDSTDRRSLTATATDGTSGAGVISSVQPRIAIGAASGGAVDITLRISAPQLEQGAFATSPIITDGTAVTRQADRIKLNDGLLAQVYGGGPVSVLTEFEAEYVSGGGIFSRIWQMDDGTNDNRLTTSVAENSGNSNLVMFVGGVSQAESPAAYTSGATLKIASRFKTDDFAISRNGGTVDTDASGSMPTGLINLGISNSGFNTTNNSARLLRLRKLIVYPAALTNAELVALST